MNDPAEVVKALLDGLEAGKIEILADRFSVDTKASLADEPRAFDLQTASVP